VIDDLPLFIEDSGTPGPPIVLIHGFGANLSTWRFWTDDLSRDHRVIQVDLKGCGRAPSPRDGRYAPTDHADLIEALVDRLALERVTFIGHSLGGGISLIVAMRLLKRRPAALAKLVLVGTAAYRQSMPRFIGLARLPLIGALGLRAVPGDWLIGKVLEEITYDPSTIEAAQVENYARPLRRPGVRYALLQTARQIVPTGLDEITNGYAEINVPVLLVWGRQDPVIPLEVGRRLAEALPESELVVLDRCGHIPPEERPNESLAAVRRFLIPHEISTTAASERS
jgi:pimeloyl-ACP methyl ester carboxylesterase